MIARSPLYAAPRPISAENSFYHFDCGRPELNAWLHRRAIKNEGRASRTYVICSGSNEVVAFYTLSAGAAELQAVPTKLARNMPNPVPLIVLGRLAVDRSHAGRGLGSFMLREALQRALHAADTIGVHALVVHAIDDAAVAFYTRFGFQAFPTAARSLFLPIETIARSL